MQHRNGPQVVAGCLCFIIISTSLVICCRREVHTRARTHKRTRHGHKRLKLGRWFMKHGERERGHSARETEQERLVYQLRPEYCFMFDIFQCAGDCRNVFIYAMTVHVAPGDDLWPRIKLWRITCWKFAYVLTNVMYYSRACIVTCTHICI